MSYTYKEPQSVESLEQLFAHVQEEFRKVASEFGKVSTMQFQVLNVAPERPRAGLVAVADGTNWNPGAGAGIYLYVGGVWTKL